MARGAAPREGLARRALAWLASPPSAAGAQGLTSAATPLRVGRDRITPANAQWQTEVWAFYDDLSEFGYGVDWLAEMVSRVRLLAARAPAGDGDEPAPVDLDDLDKDLPEVEARLAAELVAELAGGMGGQAQMLGQLTVQLSVPGEGWLVGETLGDGGTRWEVRSTDELRTARSGASSGGAQGIEVIDEHTSAGGMVAWRRLADDSLVVRIWRPHPRYRYQADSPARHARSTMRELELANRRIQTDYLSRLASAGVWLIPEEVTFPADPRFADEPDPFVAELIDTASTAIATPGSAAAAIPIPLRVPADMIEQLAKGFIDFTTTADDQLLEKRASAIRRLATGLNLPAEVLLGMGDVSHWGQWFTEESAIKTNISPIVELICQCLTVGYLWPRLAAAGLAEPKDWLVWYDPSELTVRPDRSDDAIAAYDRLELSGDALRRETGFSEADRPDDEELKRLVLLKMATDPAQATAALEELGFIEPPEVPAGLAPGEGGATPPQPSGGPPPPPAVPPEPGRRTGPPQPQARPPAAPGTAAPTRARVRSNNGGKHAPAP